MTPSEEMAQAAPRGITCHRSVNNSMPPSPQAALPSLAELASMDLTPTTPTKRWAELCADAMNGKRTLLDSPEYLIPLIKSVNHRLGDYVQLLVEGEGAESRPKGDGPSATDRRRELLPLPCRIPETALFPGNDFYTGNAKTRNAARDSWVVLMVAVLNYHFLLGAEVRKITGLRGPPSPAQEAALIRLATVADTMCALSPLEFGDHDWAAELPLTRIGYDGGEVLRAEPLSLARMLPTLPPKGVAASLDLLPLVHGFTRDALLDPSLVRIPDAEVDPLWTRPQIRLAEGEDQTELLVELFHRGLLRVVDKSEIWQFQGKPVTNGMFGVPKPTKPAMQVEIAGVKHDLQRLICHLVPTNCLQVRLEGDIETLPHAGQWDCVHLLAFELFVGSERDRFCYFYVYRMPAAWRGSMTLCVCIEPEKLGLPAGPPVHLDLQVPGMGWVSAVGITQMAHRTMMQYVETPQPALGNSALLELSLVPVFILMLEVRKDRPFPVGGRPRHGSLEHLHRQPH